MAADERLVFLFLDAPSKTFVIGLRDSADAQTFRPKERNFDEDAKALSAGNASSYMRVAWKRGQSTIDVGVYACGVGHTRFASHSTIRKALGVWPPYLEGFTYSLGGRGQIAELKAFDTSKVAPCG